jgi:uncharacterized protein with GYD domain
MPHYLVQVSYTPEAWAAQLKNPQDRRAIVRPLFDRLGGRIETAFFALGPYDVVLIAELPDDRRAAALSLALTAGGAIKAIQTTPLLTIEQGIEAMREAAEAWAVYQPPVAALEAFEEGP